jgi:hypothetical protein
MTTSKRYPRLVVADDIATDPMFEPQTLEQQALAAAAPLVAMGLINPDPFATGERMTAETRTKLLAMGYMNPEKMDAGFIRFALNDPDKAKREAKRIRERIKATPFDPSVPVGPRPWIYGRHYIRGFVSGTSAPTKMGKSTVDMVEAVSMMTAFDLLRVGAANMPPKGQRLKVWLWNGEDPEDELRRRLMAICRYYGRIPKGVEPDEPPHDRFDFEYADLRNYLYLDSGRDNPIKIASFEDGKVKVAVPVVKDMIATIRDNGIDVTNIDPFITSHSIPENSERMDEVVGQYKDIAYQTRSAIEHVHHTRKIRDGAEVTSTDSRGSSAIVAAWRDSRVLNFMDTQTATEQGIKNRFRFLRLGGDGNMTVRGEDDRWLYMETVTLDNADAETGLPADDVGVAVPFEPVIKTEAAKASDEVRILSAVLKLIDGEKDKPETRKRITRERGGDYTIKTLVGYLKRAEDIIATADEVRGVLDRAIEGRVLLNGEKAPIYYFEDSKRGKSGYRRVAQ